MNRFCSLVLAAVVGVAFADDDAIWVAKNDPNAGDTAVEGRGGEALPYRTLQAAIKAAPANSTIKVKPGVYDEGATITTETGDPQSNRVYIAKTIHLVSTEGKEKTHIRGKWGTNGTDPDNHHLGTDAVRCIYVTSAGKDSMVEGFTIANGATRWASSGTGGVYAPSGLNLVDCTVTNCYSSGPAAGLNGGTAFRCLIGWNGGRSWESGDAESAKLWNCVIVNTRRDSAEYAVYKCTLVNCTVVGMISTGQLRFGSSVCYNTLSCPFNYTMYNYAEGQGGTMYNTNTLYRSSYSEPKQLYNPFFGDYRLLNTSVAVGAGEAKYVVGDEAPIQLPDGVEAKDFYGNDLSGLTGAINCGASQSVVTPQYGCVRCSTNRMKLNGEQMNVEGYAYPTNWPVRWEVAPYSGTMPLFWTQRHYKTATAQAGKENLYPALDGRSTFIPSPTAGTVLSLTINVTSLELYVDDEKGSLTNGTTGAQGDPYKTIQQALDYASTAGKNVLIHVAPGVYDEGGKEADGLFNRIYYNSISSSVRILADEGPEQTFIVGSTNETDDIRCARIHKYVCLQGFTLKDGRSCGDTGETKNGAAVRGGYVRDCIITNCTATGSLRNDGDSCVGNVWRTRFVGNTFYRGWGEASVWAFNVFAGNTITGVLFDNNLQGTHSYFTTITGNTWTKPSGVQDVVAMWRGSLDDCIIDMNGYSIAGRDSTAPNILWNYSYKNGGSNNFVEENPRLTAADQGDYHPDVLSPAKGLGTVPADFFIYLDRDVYGNEFLPDADGKPAVGAVQTFNSFYEVTAAAEGLAVTGGKVGYELVPAGTSKTISISKKDGSTRNVLGIVVKYGDGTVETNLFADLPGGTWTHTVSDNDTSVGVTAYYEPNLYVDAVNGDNSYDGLTAATAKKTLANNGLILVDGDVVHVAPGTYDSETNAYSTVTARVVIPEGVSFVASGAQDETIIQGTSSPSVRGVYMRARSRLEGFTLTGGPSSVNGACVYAETVGVESRRPRVVNCKVTCPGYCLSALYQVAAYGCLVGTSIYCSYMVSASVLYNCRVISSGGSVACNGGKLTNTTILPTSGGAYNIFSSAATCYNSILYGAATKDGTYKNCLFATNSQYQAGSSSVFTDPSGCTDCVFTNISALALDASLRPTSLSTPVIDGASNAWVSVGDADCRFDLAGVPRIGHYRVDFGAYEYHDYRAEMKEIAGRSIASVDWYSSNTVVNAEGKILLDGDGATLEMTKRGASGLETFVTMTGEGALTALVNGVSAATLSATGILRVDAIQAGDKVTFAYAGTGTAVFGNIRRPRGLAVLLR